MEKILPNGTFAELDEREVMEMEGGILVADPNKSTVINDPRSALGNITAGAIAGIPGGWTGVAYGVMGGIVASYIDGSISTEYNHESSQTRNNIGYLLIPTIL